MKELIIKEYLSGLSITKLLEKYPDFNRRQINNILEKNKIAIRGGRKKKQLSQEQKDEVIKMVTNKASLKEISNYCNLSQETMKKILKELNLKITNKKRINKNLKSDYFSIIDTPEKAYWLGFLYTDGCVDHYRSTGRIRLQLQEKDIEILEKFKSDLGIESSIIYDKRKNSTCCSVEFTDEQIYNDLSKYNIVPRKTYIINHIPYELIPKKFLKSYALGLFDGDGCLSCSKNFSTDVTLSYTAYHKEEVEDFQKIINLVCNTGKYNKNFFYKCLALSMERKNTSIKNIKYFI